MKTFRNLFALAIILILGFNSCREIKVTTKVNPDGTFTRIVKVTGDSSEVLKKDLPFPVDNTWLQVFSRDTADTNNFSVVYSKTFKNSDRLNEEIKMDTTDYRFIEKQISVIKKPGFFYSYLSFKEVYKCVNPFNTLDYRQFVSENDIRISNGTEIPITPADSVREKDAENNIFDYLLKSAVAELESITSEGIKKLDYERLNAVKLADYHDSLCSAFERGDIKKGEEVLDLYSKWSGVDDFSMLKTLQPPLYQAFDQKLARLDILLGLEGYEDIVEMPGLITGTNSARLNGNQVSWEFEILPLMVRDTEFFAESRVINHWSFILSGVVLFALVTLLLVKSFRK